MSQLITMNYRPNRRGMLLSAGRLPGKLITTSTECCRQQQSWGLRLLSHPRISVMWFRNEIPTLHNQNVAVNRKVKDWDLSSHPRISVMWFRNEIPTFTTKNLRERVQRPQAGIDIGIDSDSIAMGGSAEDLVGGYDLLLAMEWEIFALALLKLTWLWTGGSAWFSPLFFESLIVGHVMCLKTSVFESAKPVHYVNVTFMNWYTISSLVLIVIIHSYTWKRYVVIVTVISYFQVHFAKRV